MNAIETRALTKSFNGTVKAVDTVDLAIPKGTVFGFLGPNGAGKTTVIRLINGVLKPDAGEAYVLGNRSEGFNKQIHLLCGVMTENASLYEGMSADDNLSFFGEIFGMNRTALRARIDQLLDLFDLRDARGKRVKEYSTGMKKRLSLARALLHNPEVLFLDEPTSGLDPEAARNVNDFIRKIARELGMTVFLCTHQLRYAEDICDLYGFIDKGTLTGFGTFEDLLRQKTGSVQLEVRGRDIPQDIVSQYKAGDVYRIPVTGDDESAAYIRQIIKAGGTIFEAKQLHWNLEDLYFAFQAPETDKTEIRS